MVGNDLPKVGANYGPLSPITFLQRAANVYPSRFSVIYGQRRFTWAQTYERCSRMASALVSRGVSPGDTVDTPDNLCPTISMLLNSWINFTI
jgi:acyl-CoA synthetase (AMP-forming)/AMP-acid ligase II